MAAIAEKSPIHAAPLPAAISAAKAARGSASSEAVQLPPLGSKLANCGMASSAPDTTATCPANCSSVYNTVPGIAAPSSAVPGCPSAPREVAKAVKYAVHPVAPSRTVALAVFGVQSGKTKE